MNAERVQAEWVERTGEFSPHYYAYYGHDEKTTQLETQVTQFAENDSRILELGCSSGRHLAALLDAGFSDLTGIDINPNAFRVMAEYYPRLAEKGTFICNSIEDILPDFADNEFDLVYSVETLQHIHPDKAWVFDEIARITRSVIITIENEDSASAQTTGKTFVDDNIPLYHRDWNLIFTERGFAEILSKEIEADTLRVFRPRA